MVTDAWITTQLFFNRIWPEQGYGGQRIKFYGATFYPNVDYYAKFGKLGPIPIFFRNHGLLEGRVPKREKIGPVAVSLVNKEGNLVCWEMRPFEYVDRDYKNAEEDRAYGKVDQGGAHRDAKDTTRRLEGSKKAHGGCSFPAQEPSSQAGRYRTARDDGVDAQDEMGGTLWPAPEPIGTPLQVLSNENENENLRPWANVPAVTTTATASFQAIKASSQRQTSQSIVLQWLKSNHDLENGLSSRKRKRGRVNMETEETVGQLGGGGSVLGSNNLPLSPGLREVTKEDPPVVLTDAGHNDPEAAQAPKRRRIQGPSPTTSRFPQ